MPLSGTVKGEGHPLARFHRASTLGGFLGQSPESLGRAHNYESEARSYSGLYQGQALYLPTRSLRHMLAMDKVYQILVNVLVGKTVIHLELAAKVI